MSWSAATEAAMLWTWHYPNAWNLRWDLVLWFERFSRQLEISLAHFCSLPYCAITKILAFCKFDLSFKFCFDSPTLITSLCIFALSATSGPYTILACLAATDRSRLDHTCVLSANVSGATIFRNLGTRFWFADKCSLSNLFIWAYRAVALASFLCILVCVLSSLVLAWAYFLFWRLAFSIWTARFSWLSLSVALTR